MAIDRIGKGGNVPQVPDTGTTHGPGASFLLLAVSLFTASLLGLAVQRAARVVVVAAA